MSDRDPFIQAENDNQSAQVIQIESLGKGGVAVVLATVIAALIIAAVSWGDARIARRDAGIAERETRIMRDEIDRMKVEMQINTNH
jgi:hypothetical protein